MAEELRALLQLFVMPIMNTEDDSVTCRLFVLPVSEPDSDAAKSPTDGQVIGFSIITSSCTLSLSYPARLPERSGN
jgi:hypothetical protein